MWTRKFQKQSRNSGGMDMEGLKTLPKTFRKGIKSPSGRFMTRTLTQEFSTLAGRGASERGKALAWEELADTLSERLQEVNHGLLVLTEGRTDVIILRYAWFMTLYMLL